VRAGEYSVGGFLRLGWGGEGNNRISLTVGYSWLRKGLNFGKLNKFEKVAGTSEIKMYVNVML
jgi:hypothetical protein